MKKNIAYPLVCFAFIIGLFASYSLHETIGIAQQPDYAKWGKMAITVVKENYVDAEVSEYKYEGRKSINEVKAEDTFVFQVKRENQTTPVKVVVTFNPKTNTLQSLSLEELKQP
jgi:hypothetical protein